MELFWKFSKQWQGSSYCFAFLKLSSSYCNRKVVNHEKNVKQFFSQGKFNSSKLYFSIILSSLHPHFTHPLHIIIKRNIVYTQSYIAKCKICFSIRTKNFRLPRAKIHAVLGIFVAKWVSNNNSNAAQWFLRTSNRAFIHLLEPQSLFYY